MVTTPMNLLRLHALLIAIFTVLPFIIRPKEPTIFFPVKFRLLSRSPYFHVCLILTKVFRFIYLVHYLFMQLDFSLLLAFCPRYIWTSHSVTLHFFLSQSITLLLSPLHRNEGRLFGCVRPSLCHALFPVSNEIL